MRDNTRYGVERGIVENLHCPFCGGNLKVQEIFEAHNDQILYGVVHCQCFAFPIVEGILCLLPPYYEKQKAAVDSLQNGLFMKARDKLLSLDEATVSRSMKGFRLLNKFAGKMGLSFFDKLYQRMIEIFTHRVLESRNFFDLLDRSLVRGSLYRDYMKFRFSTPSLLVGFILLAATHEKNIKRIIDIGSGFGHNLFFMSRLYPESDLFAVDWDFFQLYVSKLFFSLKTVYICADLNYPFCFPDNFFDMAFTSDCLHYIICKKIFVDEMKRLLDENEFFISAHMHNVKANNIAPGIPLDPDGWISLFKNMNHVMLSESKLLDQYFYSDEVDLSETDDCNDCHSMVILGGKDRRRFKVYKNVSDNLRLTSTDALILNPIFGVERINSLIHLLIQWPSENYRTEFSEIEKYFWPHICEALDLRQKAVVEKLTKHFIVINVPNGLVKATSHLRLITS